MGVFIRTGRRLQPGSGLGAPACAMKPPSPGGDAKAAVRGSQASCVPAIAAPLPEKEKHPVRTSRAPGQRRSPPAPREIPKSRCGGLGHGIYGGGVEGGMRRCSRRMQSGHGN
ncbi:virion coat protein [Gallid alphaherpesvirus 3]|uniref:ORF3 protein n=1 Tax=Gallid alphaherpesvirus 3 TaxID=35250 RepID=F8TBX7_9ALPH|nr:ORF3 protein [Gallid alphaherpesvirus 3]YP_010795671.1 virion coat protein [Gallid alphaherpesvirus 3]AEI00188.1 ORF3 protein [Gallid alphaherpesvirus 3]AEI00280.1 virion coat protein [Gallid alphaherpesvirus 3]QEY02302.1 ORF3 protein [Gallid alphaherpesvirus 3]QEY02303.1 virion coat protein [Gallid alphaherpesvirus 3]